MANLIIVFREVLEASLIIGILYTYLKKSGNNLSIKMLWSGVVAAIIASILCSFLFQKFAGGFEGNSSKIFEGIVMIFAAIILSTMIFWMARNKNITENLKNKASKALLSKFGYGIFVLSFISVFREGVETILFLYAVPTNQEASIFPSLFGGFLGLLAGYAVFVQGSKIPIKKFFNITSVFLIFVASGMLTYGVHELESGGVIPYFSGSVQEVDGNLYVSERIGGDTKKFSFNDTNKQAVKKDAEKWSSRLWNINPSKNNDGTYPMFHDKGAFGGLIKGFFGYNGNPSLIELLTWLISIAGLNLLWRKIGDDAKRKESK